MRERIASFRNLIRICGNYLESRRGIQTFIVFSFFFAIFFIVYFSVSTIAANDDLLFHFRFAQQLIQNGFLHSFYDFKSIYFSKIAQGNIYFAYYNFLYYLVILPFTLITPLFLGMKLFAVCAAAFAFTLLYFCLKRFEVKYPFIWTVLILAISSTSSVWRFFSSRPYTLAPAFLVLLLYFLYKKNYIGVFSISLIYFYWHDATFFFPLCVAVGYFIIEKFYHSRGDYKNLLSTFFALAIGIGLTLLISHGFFEFVKDVVFGDTFTVLNHAKIPIMEGRELYPVDFFNFVQGNSLIFAAFVTTLVADLCIYVSFRRNRMSSTEYLGDLPLSRRILQMNVLVITAMFFLGVLAISGRFGDYFTFFAALYIALSVDYIRRTTIIKTLPIIRRGVLVGLSVVLIYLFTSNMLFLQDLLGHGPSPFEMYGTGTWLVKNTKPGDIVFEANWSWFPGLYYYSPKNDYVMGIEPRFLYTYNPSLYWLQTHISQNGYVCNTQTCDGLQKAEVTAFSHASTSLTWAQVQGDKIAQSLVHDFQSQYVVTSKDYKIFDYVMDHNKHFKQVFYDPQFEYSIYKVTYE